MIDLRLAARATESPARAALYLRHADDEARHAQIFERRAAEILRADGRAPLGRAHADTEHLFARLGEVGFLAFVHHGEARALQQFEGYRHWFEARGRRRDASVLQGIMKDERRHADYTWDLLVALCGDDASAERAVARARRWELWRRWRRLGRGLAAPIYGALALVLYVVAAPLSLIVRLARPVRAGYRNAGGR